MGVGEWGEEGGRRVGRGGWEGVGRIVGSILDRVGKVCGKSGNVRKC